MGIICNQEIGIKMKKLKLGLPSGSLQDSTFDLFERAGYKIRLSSRSYIPTINDSEMEGLMFRAQEMAQYVARGVVDVGLTGKDWILENDADIIEIGELIYSKATSRPVRWVIAVPEESSVQTVHDLNGKRVATELVGATRRYFENHGVEAEVEFSWGTTEVKARIPGLVDAIVELTETGSSLKANRLRIVDTVCESTTRLIANKDSWEDPWKRERAENLYILINGALEAEAKVGLKMNVPRSQLDVLIEKLPAMRTPTVSDLMDRSWVAIEIVADESEVRQLIPQLKRIGAEGLIEYPLNKVIH